MAHRPRARCWATSPPEIMALVASHLPNPAHRAECVLVSKAWSDLWTPLLWRCVILSTHAQCQRFLSVENRSALQRHAHHIRFLSTPEGSNLGNLLIQPDLQGCQFLHELDIEFPLPPLPIRRRRGGGRRGGVVRPPEEPALGAAEAAEAAEVIVEVVEGAEAGVDAAAVAAEATTEVVEAMEALTEAVETAEPAAVATEAEAQPVETEAEAVEDMTEAAEVQAAVAAALAEFAEATMALAEATVALADAIMETGMALASAPTTNVPQSTAPLLSSPSSLSIAPSIEELEPARKLLPLSLMVEWIRRNPGLKHLSLKGDFDELKLPSAPDFIQPASNTPTLFHRLESSSLVSLTLDFQQNHSNQRFDLYGPIQRSESSLPVLNGLTHFSIRGFSGNDDLVLSFLERCPNLKELEFHAWLSPLSFLKKMASLRVAPSASLSSLPSNTSSLSVLSSFLSLSTSLSSSSSSSLSSPSSSLALPPPWSSIHLQKLESMVWDVPREMTDRKLSRLLGAAESAYGWKRLTIPRISKGFGPLSRQALMKYVTRIESFVVGGVQGFDSPSIQRFLESATSLKRFEGLNREEDTSPGSCLRAYDLNVEVGHLYDAEEKEQDIARQEISAPWACAKTLKSLALLITDVPRSDICFQYDGTPWDGEAHAEYWVTDTYVQFWGSDTTQEQELLQLEKDLHRRGYTQLGQMKELQELYLGQTPGNFVPAKESEQVAVEVEEEIVLTAAVEEAAAAAAAAVALTEEALTEDMQGVAQTEDTPVEDAPVEDAPMEETPEEETSVEEAPVEEAPEEEAPGEEVLTEQVPVEEIPGEETPAVEVPLQTDAVVGAEAEVPPQPQQHEENGEAHGVLDAFDAWFRAIGQPRATQVPPAPSRTRTTMLPFQYGCLRLSLESGLDLMKDLKQLRILDVSGMAHRIGVEELEWMHVNWPRLRRIEGLLTSPSGWADEAFQTKRKQEVEAWLHEHQWGIGCSYY